MLLLVRESLASWNITNEDTMKLLVMKETLQFVRIKKDKQDIDKLLLAFMSQIPKIYRAAAQEQTAF